MTWLRNAVPYVLLTVGAVLTVAAVAALTNLWVAALLTGIGTATAGLTINHDQDTT